MKLQFTSKADPLASTVRLFTTGERSKIPRQVTEAELSLQPSSKVFLHAENQLLVGVGQAQAVTADIIRKAVGTAVAALRKAGRLKVNIDLTKWPQFAGPAVEGAIMAGYSHDDFKDKKAPSVERVTFVVPVVDLVPAKIEAQRAQILAEMTNLARKVANQPGNVVYPATLAEQAQWHAKAFGLHCTVLDEKKLRAQKFGGLLAVGSGSQRAPRLIMLEHRHATKKNEPPLVLIGKAITFDSGGISIKSHVDMSDMIWDKCGGCAVLGAMLAIAKLKLKRNVVGLIPSAENMVSGHSYRPGDIVTCHGGKRVEIIDTDAEGRMILADCIAYAHKTLGASAIIDIATLTGACGVALGTSAAGLWASDESLKKRVLSAADATGETLWPMPIFPEHEEAMRSEVATLKNLGTRMGGACSAAAFLKAFAEKTPWAHLDIAYPARITKENGWLARGATGFGVRTLVTIAEGFGAA